MSLSTFFEGLEQKVSNFFSGIPQESQDVLTASNKFLNVVKNLSTSAPGQLVIDLAEAFIPGGSAVITGAEAILNELTGITSETPGQVLLLATQKAAAMTGTTAKVSAFSNIVTAVASAANDVAKGTLTAPQITSLNQLVHDSTTLDTPAPTPPVIQTQPGDTAFVQNANLNQLTPEQIAQQQQAQAGALNPPS